MKTFKSTKSTLELTVVRTNEDLVRIITQLPDETGRAIDLAPSDAPALALAILEDAGFNASPNSSFNIAASYLINGIKEQERITAEAEAQAELEAEAFNLYRTYIAVHEPMDAIGDWQMLSERTKERWLAVARKAREMRAEK